MTVIIDCLEIFIERPSNLQARTATWSNYEHHNTVKLLGCMPQGVISYISSAWGGRVSDKSIVTSFTSKDDTPLIDSAICVCCVLTNLCNSVILVD